jgi:ABC-type nitrate/sulfonate/bicarbonate transport system permease component
MSTKRKRLRKLLAGSVLIAILGLLFMTAAVALAQPGPAEPAEPQAFGLTWDVVASGGTSMSSAHYIMQSTAGQGVVGQSSSVGFGLHSGYWYGIRNYINRVFMPMLRRE